MTTWSNIINHFICSYGIQAEWLLAIPWEQQFILPYKRVQSKVDVCRTPGMVEHQETLALASGYGERDSSFIPCFGSLGIHLQLSSIKILQILECHQVAKQAEHGTHIRAQWEPTWWASLVQSGPAN